MDGPMIEIPADALRHLTDAANLVTEMFGDQETMPADLYEYMVDRLSAAGLTDVLELGHDESRVVLDAGLVTAIGLADHVLGEADFAASGDDLDHDLGADLIADDDLASVAVGPGIGDDMPSAARFGD